MANTAWAVIKYPQVIPMLVPGQQWQSLWDMLNSRHEAELPDVHEALVDCEDSQGQVMPRGRYVLDWQQWTNRLYTTTYDLHDVGEAMRDIRKLLKSWGEGPGGRGGLSVYSRDGAAQDEQARQRHAAWQREQRDSEG